MVVKITNFQCNAPVDRNLINALLTVCSELNSNDLVYLQGSEISAISPRHQINKLPPQLGGILSAISRKGFAFRVSGRECAGGIFIAKTFPAQKKRRAQSHA